MSDDRLFSEPSRRPLVLFGFRLALALLAVLLLALFISELWSAQRQYRTIRTYIPVNATVLSSRVTSYKGSKGRVHYVPRVRYRYEVEGRSYESETLAPLRLSGGEAWAGGVVNQYKGGQACRAFYDPRDPGRAVLLLRFSFEPYFSMLELALVVSGMSFFVLGTWFTLGRGQPVLAENGWFEIKPRFGERQRLLTAKVCTWLWYGLGGVPAVHYFLCAQAPYPSRALKIFFGFALLGLVPVGLTIRYALMNRNLDEARLRLDQPVTVLGRRFRFVISQCVRRQLQVKKLRVRLVCIGTGGQGNSRVRRVLYEAVAVEENDRVLHSGETLELSGELTLPSDQRPGGRDAAREFNWIAWEMQMESKIAGAPDYSAAYALEVQAPAAEAWEPGAGGSTFRTVVEVQPVEPRFAHQILTKGKIALGYLISLSPLPFLPLGVGMLAAAYPVLFPGDKDFPRWIELSHAQATALLAGGVALIVVTSIYGLVFPSLLSSLYIHWLAKRAIGLRANAIVRPGPDSLLVDIIPRTNWNRVMLETAADIGFVMVDAQRREIRFEGDRERYRIPVDALRSCKLEKSCSSETASRSAPGIWMAVIGASGPAGGWEAPMAPRLLHRRASSKLQQGAAQELYAKIAALLPDRNQPGSAG